MATNDVGISPKILPFIIASPRSKRSNQANIESQHVSQSLDYSPLLTNTESPTTAHNGNVPAEGNNVAAALWTVGISPRGAHL